MTENTTEIDTATFDAIQDITPEIASRAKEIATAYASRLTPEAILLMLKTSDYAACLNIKLALSIFEKRNGEKAVDIAATAKIDGKVKREEEGMHDRFTIPGTGPDLLPGF